MNKIISWPVQCVETNHSIVTYTYETDSSDH